jgi:hypothetical protein
MHTVEFLAGEPIARAAAQLVEAAREHGSARGSFNEIELTAEAGTTVDQVLATWERENAERAEAYRKSPEGMAAERERIERRSALQQKHDDLMRSLPALDMWNDAAVLDWLCAMQEPSDHAGVIVTRDTIVSWFEKHGYVAGANCGPDFRKGDRENEFRYLVGQALDGLKRGPSIHGIIHKFAAEWKAEFLPTAH